MPNQDSFIQEWKQILQSMKETLEGFDLPGHQERYQDAYSKLSEIDAYHSHLQNDYSHTIEAKKNVENSLKLMSDFFTEAPIGYIVLSSDGAIEDANNIASEYWGIERLQLRRTRMHLLVSSEHISLFDKAFNATLFSLQRRSLDLKCTRPDAGSFWARIDMIQSREMDTGIKRVLCSIVDITSDRMLEDAIKKTAVGLTAATGSIFFHQLTDFLAGYLNVDYAMIAQFDGDCTFKSLAVSSSHQDAPTECTYKRDRFNDFLTNRRYLKTQELGPHHIDGICSHFEVADGISMFLFDSSGTVLGELSILTKKRFFDKNIFASVLKVVSARASAELQRLNVENELTNYRELLEEKIEQRTKDLLRNNAILEEEIEKRKKFEKKLQLARIEAEEATKAKSTFLANMSHEIRTPMSGIIGVTALMERQELSPILRDYINIIKASGNSLLHIINDILDISKLESGKMEFDIREINLRTLLHNILESFVFKAQVKHLYLFLDYPHDLPELIATDSVRLRQVVDNLISNAIKFTDNGHVIVTVRFLQDRSSLEISVEDSGAGFSKSTREVIFQRFAQGDSSTTRKHDGTGLGLSISKKIIELLGGTIDCESEQNVGSKFWFVLPVEYSSPTGSDTLKPIFKANKVLFLLCLQNELLENALANNLQTIGQNVVRIQELNSVSEQIANHTLVVITDQNINTVNSLHQYGLEGKPCILASLHDAKDECLNKSDLITFVSIQKSFSAEKILKQLDLFQSLESASELINETSVKTTHVTEKIKVLLAEDNEINRIVAVDMLSFLGAQVDVAFDGEKAVEKFISDSYDIVFMDCLMPNMDGFQALEIIKSVDKANIPVVAMTANAMKGDRERCLKAGFDDYISKPLDIDELRLCFCRNTKEFRMPRVSVILESADGMQLHAEQSQTHVQQGGTPP